LAFGRVDPISSTLPENPDTIDRGSLHLPVAAGLVERLEAQISYPPRLISHFQSSSASRLTAGAAGFLNLSQSFDRLER
jgi:hypothetical protein